MKEITGSGIFAAKGEDDALESGSANPIPNKTGLRMYQVLLDIGGPECYIRRYRFLYLY